MCVCLMPGFGPTLRDLRITGLNRNIICNVTQCDVDENEELAQAAGVAAMPTFQVYKNGKKVRACVD